MAVARDGSWLAACQAREDSNGDGKVEVMVGQHGDLVGDTASLYLMRGEGPGEPLESIEAREPTDRWLVTREAGALYLRDVHRGTREKLDAFVPPLEHREDYQVASLDGRGGRVAFLRADARGHLVPVVRGLSDGKERVLASPPGELHVVDLVEGGTHLGLALLRDDTDKDGKLQWPQQRTTAARGVCRGSAYSASYFGYSGDRPVFVLVPLGGGAASEASDVVERLELGLMRRTQAGAYVLQTPDGATREWVPASCAGELVHVDAARQLALVACRGASDDAGQPLWLYGPGVEKPVDLGVAPLRVSRRGIAAWRSDGERLVGIHAYVQSTTGRDGTSAHVSPGALVDLERRTALRFDEGRVLHAHGGRAVVRVSSKDGTRSWLLDADTGARTELPPAGPDYYPDLSAGSLVSVEGVVVDLATGRPVGRVPPEAEAIDVHGRFLEIAQPGRPSIGPARWVQFLPLEATPTP